MSVTGEAYFAVTPKVAMGGALIRVTLRVGPVRAWLDAGFDCLINFHPLHYRADFHVSIGVAFDMDFWFVHIHISCSVGAWLSIQGPQFGGIAQYVGLGLCDPSISNLTNLFLQRRFLFVRLRCRFWRKSRSTGPSSSHRVLDDAPPAGSSCGFAKHACSRSSATTSPA